MWWPFRRRDHLIDTLIKPPTYVYAGHQEALAVRTRQRRDQAERIRRDARLIETRDDTRVALRRVK